MKTILQRTSEEKKNDITYEITFYYDDGMVEKVDDVVEVIRTRQMMFGGGSSERYECETTKGCVSASSDGLEKIIAVPSNEDTEIELVR